MSRSGCNPYLEPAALLFEKKSNQRTEFWHNRAPSKSVHGRLQDTCFRLSNFDQTVGTRLDRLPCNRLIQQAQPYREGYD